MTRNYFNLPIVFGSVLLATGLFVLITTYLPIFKNEVSYQVLHKKVKTDTTINPIDSDFGIVIPKIGANSKIIKNVDPFDSTVYQKALTKGVAHANTSKLPGEGKNIFLFSHSSTDFLTATRYNSIFYLLSKLEEGDEIKVFYKQKEYQYKVKDKKVVTPSQINFLKSDSNAETLTLMTCWPPGTDFKRLIVQAVPK
ncbi:hypothetical protein A2572_04670 [Candidatus Collierbacteria bacterium RIFOXYD1_FULL_40_9]|uniref:Sortase n=1 Tax=Candidatus Collierbacteria bacterium RIFOXYD1_FULL_40_9 TaxID=1817731 RepID=A0A1F5FUP6_9BACT|nr:MAG: hypothetical protein A2572_04670 [Candidatus Collierbacteria bacterium RIFOXYD1_FULL_40_9]